MAIVVVVFPCSKNTINNYYDISAFAHDSDNSEVLTKMSYNHQ